MAFDNNPYLGSNNPYLQEVIDGASRDMIKNYNLNTQPAYNAAMVKSGSFGNAGVDEMNRNAQSQLQQNLGGLASSLRFQDYNNQQNMYRWDSEFDRNLYNDAYGQNMNNLTTGIGLLGTLAGYNANDYTTATGVQNTPLNYLTQFSNLAGAAGRGGQTTSTSGGGSSPLVSALGGAQLGSSLMNRYNWQPNTSTGSSNWANGTGSYSQYNQPDYGQFF